MVKDHLRGIQDNLWGGTTYGKGETLAASGGESAGARSVTFERTGGGSAGARSVTLERTFLPARGVSHPRQNHFFCD